MQTNGSKGLSRVLGLLGIAGLSILLPTVAHAAATASVRLAWNPSPDAMVAGYTVCYGASSGNYPQRLDVGSQVAATVTGLTEGSTYYFTVTAYATNGMESVPSNEVEYSVPVSPTNQPPSIIAGADQSVTLPAGASLSGTATDDGLPTGSSLTTTWTAISGPGTVTFANASALATTASFSAAGTYILRLTATDGDLSTSDELTVTVSPAAQPNQAPVVVAGDDQTVTAHGGANLLGAATDDGLPTGSSLVTTWSMVSGPGTVTFGNANALATTADFSKAGTYVLRLTATDGALTAYDELTVTVVPGNSKKVTLAWDASPDANVVGYALYYGTNSGSYDLRVDAGTNTTATVSNLEAGATYYFVVVAYDSTGMESVPSNEVIYSVPNDPTNLPPTVVAGPDLSITLPATADLEGSVSDDGMPTALPGLTASWSAVSGPGTVTFKDANSPATTASFSEAGTYVLRLTASDGELSAYDEVTVTVAPVVTPDAPPVISNLALSSQGATLNWPSIPGRTYRVVYKNSFSDTQWQVGSADLPATGDTLTWVDSGATTNSQRFYAIVLLP